MLTDGLESRKQNQFAASHAALHQKTGAFGLHMRRRGAALQPANAQGKERIYCNASGRGLGGCSRAAFLKRDGRKDAVNVFT